MNVKNYFQEMSKESMKFLCKTGTWSRFVFNFEKVYQAEKMNQGLTPIFLEGHCPWMGFNIS